MTALKQSRILIYNHQPKTIETFVMSSVQKLQDLFFFLSYENGTFDDKELSVLHEDFVPKTPDFSYEGRDCDFRPDVI